MHTNYVSVTLSDRFDLPKLEKWLKSDGYEGPSSTPDDFGDGVWYMGKAVQIWVEKDPNSPNATVIVQAYPKRDLKDWDMGYALAHITNIAQSLLGLVTKE